MSVRVYDIDAAETIEQVLEPLVMPRYLVAKADYDTLADARQREFAYIERVLQICAKATAGDIREELRDLRAWATNRATCFREVKP